MRLNLLLIFFCDLALSSSWGFRQEGLGARAFAVEALGARIGQTGQKGAAVAAAEEVNYGGRAGGVTRSTPYRAGGAQEELERSLFFTWELREALRSVQRETGAELGQVRNIVV